MDVIDPLTAPQLAEMLHEPNTALLAKVLRVLGPERCRAILTDVLTTEASGGMLTKDGTRRRTPGGTFFHLVRDQCTKEERARLFPYVPRTNRRGRDSWHNQHTRSSRTLCPEHSPSTCGKDSPLCL